MAIFVQVPYLLSSEDWGFFLFSVTLCLQSLIALGFWSLLESLSPAKRSTELAMLLDHHYWSNGALLRKDYSLSSPCRCCLACVPFLQMDTMTWKKPLDWNKTQRKKKRKEKHSISHQSCWLSCTTLGEHGWLRRCLLQVSPDHPGHTCVTKAQLCLMCHVQVTLNVRGEFDSKFVNVGISQ